MRSPSSAPSSPPIRSPLRRWRACSSPTSPPRRRWRAMPGRLSRIDLIVGFRPPDRALLERIRRALPAGAELVSAGAQAGAIASMTAAFTLNLRALSLLALVVGMFLIYNTMTFSVVQRRTVLGTLRALGVTRGEIFTLVTVEALVLGVVGTGLGIGARPGAGPGAAPPRDADHQRPLLRALGARRVAHARGHRGGGRAGARHHRARRPRPRAGGDGDTPARGPAPLPARGGEPPRRAAGRAGGRSRWAGWGRCSSCPPVPSGASWVSSRC